MRWKKHLKTVKKELDWWREFCSKQNWRWEENVEEDEKRSHPAVIDCALLLILNYFWQNNFRKLREWKWQKKHT